MNNSLLYLTAVLIWGSTWLAIKFQLGTVDPALSVGYRFGLAAVLLFAYCKVFGLPLRFSRQAHLGILAQGVFLFCVNYVLFYEASAFLTSGLVAVIFSTVIVMNIFNAALFLGTPLEGRVMFGAGLGLIGIVLIFWPELAAFSLANAGLYGLGLGIVATYLASLGNIAAARNQRQKLPIVQTSAFGMAYGSLLIFGYALVSGKTWSFDWSFAYVGSMLYLTLFGTVIVFACYLTLLGRIGPERASYATLLFPPVALGLSTIFEGYHWSAPAIVGMGLILLGNVFVLSRGKLFERLIERLPRWRPLPARCD